MTKFAASKTGSFCNDCSPSLYSATALPLKAETFRPLAANTDVFFIEGVGYGAFRVGGNCYHHRGCCWLYKGWTKATRGGERKGKTKRRRDWERKKNWERQRTETHKTETNTSSKPRKPTLISSSSIAPLQTKKRRTQAASRDLHHHRNKRKTERGKPRK